MKLKPLFKSKGDEFDRCITVAKLRHMLDKFPDSTLVNPNQIGNLSFLKLIPDPDGGKDYFQMIAYLEMHEHDERLTRIPEAERFTPVRYE